MLKNLEANDTHFLIWAIALIIGISNTNIQHKFNATLYFSCFDSVRFKFLDFFINRYLFH